MLKDKMKEIEKLEQKLQQKIEGEEKEMKTCLFMEKKNSLVVSQSMEKSLILIKETEKKSFKDLQS